MSPPRSCLVMPQYVSPKLIRARRARTKEAPGGLPPGAFVGLRVPRRRGASRHGQAVIAGAVPISVKVSLGIEVKKSVIMNAMTPRKGVRLQRSHVLLS